MRLEISTLLNMIYSTTQTPDISFESVKGLASLSGVALRMLFLDAHLKVQNKSEIFSEYLERRMSITKKYLGLFNSSSGAVYGTDRNTSTHRTVHVDDRAA